MMNHSDYHALGILLEKYGTNEFLEEEAFSLIGKMRVMNLVVSGYLTEVSRGKLLIPEAVDLLEKRTEWLTDRHYDAKED